MSSVLQKLIKERKEDIRNREKDYTTGKHLIGKSLLYLVILLVVAILMRFGSPIIDGLSKLIGKHF